MSKPDPLTPALELKAIRASLGATQEQVSVHLGISITSYRSYEAGRNQPPDTLIWTMRRFYKAKTITEAPPQPKDLSRWIKPPTESTET